MENEKLTEANSCQYSVSIKKRWEEVDSRTYKLVVNCKSLSMFNNNLTKDITQLIRKYGRGIKMVEE